MDKAKAKRDSQLELDGNMMHSLITTVCQLQEQKFDFSASIAKFACYVEILSKLLDNTINEIKVFSLVAKCEENETYSCKDILK